MLPATPSPANLLVIAESLNHLVCYTPCLVSASKTGDGLKVDYHCLGENKTDYVARGRVVSLRFYGSEGGDVESA